MAKPIPQLKRPTIPAAVAEGFISAGSNAAVAPLPSSAQAALSVVPEPAEATRGPVVQVATESASPVAELVVEVPEPLSASPAERKAAPRVRASRAGRHVMKRASGEEVRKVTFYLPPELDQELSLHCVRNGLDRTDVVVAALRKVVRGP